MKDDALFIAEALEILCPNGFTYNGEVTEDGGVCSTVSDPVPTQAELDAKVAELKADYKAKEYQRTRAATYPELGEQFDLLWHAIDGDALDKTSDFYTKLKKVKDDNPKPE